MRLMTLRALSISPGVEIRLMTWQALSTIPYLLFLQRVRPEVTHGSLRAGQRRVLLGDQLLQPRDGGLRDRSDTNVQPRRTMMQVAGIEHRYTMWWMTWSAPVRHAERHVVDGAASTATSCG
jgi:hypothetical protein